MCPSPCQDKWTDICTLLTLSIPSLVTSLHFCFIPPPPHCTLYPSEMCVYRCIHFASPHTFTDRRFFLPYRLHSPVFCTYVLSSYLSPFLILFYSISLICYILFPLIPFFFLCLMLFILFLSPPSLSAPSLSSLSLTPVFPSLLCVISPFTAFLFIFYS